MQQFIIPQFIEVEDKIFGPITVRQFIIIMVSGMIIFLTFKYGDFALFVFTLVLLGGLSLILAFVKINGQAFHYFLLNIVQTSRKPSLRIWQKSYSKKDLNYFRKQTTEEKAEVEARKPAKRDHIRDLALLVNTGGFYRPDDEF